MTNLKKTWKKNGLLFVLMAGLAIFAVGCSDDDDNPITGPGTDLGDGASLRVVHASPDAPAVDIYAEGVSGALISALTYAETSEYLDLAAGDYNIQIRAHGAAESSLPVFETGMLSVPDGARITAIAAGKLTSTDEADRFRVLVKVENFDDPGAGNAAVRVVHASADAPAVAIDVGNDGTPEISDFARFDGDSGEAGVALPAGQPLQIGVWAGSPLARVTAFTTPALPSGGELFVIATGLLGELPREDDGFGLLAVGPEGTIGMIRQNPVVFALHASPDAPAVDIYAGDAALSTNLGFGQLSDPIQVPPASYELSFRAAGSMAEAASATTPLLTAGERYLAVASGFLGDQSFTVLPYGETFDQNGEALLRVVHASPDAPAVDVGLWDGTDFTALGPFSGIAFGQASAAEGVDVGAASFGLGVAAAESTDPVATFQLTTAPGLRVFAVAAGSLFDESAEGFRLLLVDTQVFPWVVAGEVLPE